MQVSRNDSFLPGQKSLNQCLYVIQVFCDKPWLDFADLPHVQVLGGTSSLCVS